jgi:hypothetical protein
MVTKFSNLVISRLVLACNVSRDRPDRAHADGPVALKVHQVGTPTLTRAGQRVVATVHNLPRQHISQAVGRVGLRHPRFHLAQQHGTLVVTTKFPL